MITKINEFLKYLNYKECILTEQKLNEGLIKTYNPDFVYRQLIKNLKHLDCEIFIDKEISRQHKINISEYKFPIEIQIHENITITDLLNIQKISNLCGYFISSIFFDDLKFNTIDEIVNVNNYNTVYIIIEAKYDVSFDIETLKNKYIYHVSDIKHKDKILQKGLIVKNKNKLSYHLPRIYFETDIKNIEFLKQQLNGNIVFMIDITGIKDLKFYVDPNYDSGIYTFENIKPEYIKIIE